jgi:hypothetical protein
MFNHRLVVGVVGLLATVGLAAGAGMGSAKPSSFADASKTIATADGWTVTATKSGEAVRSVPPLNQSPWTREGFVDITGSAAIAGSGGKPVQAGSLRLVLQVGCNTDVTGGAQVGIQGGPNAALNVSWPPAVNIGATVMPSFSASLKPGTITDVELGLKSLQEANAAISVNGIHVKVDGCLGPVALRAQVTVAIATPTLDSTINVYGQPHYL